jgi:hypothetical protein
MSQNWDMEQIILFSLQKKARSGFFQPEKSDGFGREPMVLSKIFVHHHNHISLTDH